MNAALHLLPDLVWLVPALPLLALVAVGLRALCGRARGDCAEPLTAQLCALAALAGLLLLLAIDLHCPRRGWLPWAGGGVLPQVGRSADWFAGESDALAPAIVLRGMP